MRPATKLSWAFPALVLVSSLGCGARGVDRQPDGPERVRVGSEPAHPPSPAGRAAASTARVPAQEEGDAARAPDFDKTFREIAETQSALREYQGVLEARSKAARREVKETYGEAIRSVEKDLEERNAALDALKQRTADNEARLKVLREKSAERVRKEAEYQAKKKELEAAIQAEAQAAGKEWRDYNTRTWTSRSTGRTQSAQFVCRIGSKVRVRDKDGKLLMLEVDDLTDGDQKWLTERGR